MVMRLALISGVRERVQAAGDAAVNRSDHGRHGMKKPVFGMVLGGVLGVFDGLVGAALGARDAAGDRGHRARLDVQGHPRRARSSATSRRGRDRCRSASPIGLAVGLALAYLVTLGEPYFWEIMLPGGIVGRDRRLRDVRLRRNIRGAFGRVSRRTVSVGPAAEGQPAAPPQVRGRSPTWATATSPDQAAYQRRGAWRIAPQRAEHRRASRGRGRPACPRTRWPTAQLTPPSSWSGAAGHPDCRAQRDGRRPARPGRDRRTRRALRPGAAAATTGPRPTSGASTPTTAATSSPAPRSDTIGHRGGSVGVDARPGQHRRAVLVGR